MKNSIIFKIKDFFDNLFHPKKLLKEGHDFDSQVDSVSEYAKFSIKDNFGRRTNESEIYILKKGYLSGKLKEEDMTDEQKQALEIFLDNQITELKKENTHLINKLAKDLLNDNALMKLFKRFQNGEIDEEELSEEQKMEFEFLYDIQIKRLVKEINDMALGA